MSKAIELAREADIRVDGVDGYDIVTYQDIQKFYTLARADLNDKVVSLEEENAKLLAGVEMPEPYGKVAYEDRPYEPAWISSQDAYTEDQLLTLRDASIQAGYLRGLDECLEICNRLTDKNMHSADCAAAIDKLKGGE